MKRTEEFERFKDGRTVTITFDDETLIAESAFMVAPEVEDGEVEITPLVNADSYWERRMFDRVVELEETEKERKYEAAYKDVSGE